DPWSDVFNTRRGSAAGQHGNGIDASPVTSERFQQLLRLAQIRGVEALSEPAVDRGEQRASLSGFALPLPEPPQVHRRPQLREPRALTRRDLARAKHASPAGSSAPPRPTT